MPERRRPVENVSERSAPEMFDRAVPYISGLSNGVETFDPIPVPINVRHTLPSWLRGVYYCIGYENILSSLYLLR